MTQNDNQQLREIKQRYKQGETAWHLDDIAFLLSQLNSQVAKGDAADRGISKLLLASDLTAEAYKKGWSDAATQMRDACVGKLKSRRDQRRRDLHALANSDNHEAKADYERAVLFVLDNVIYDLESLTLNQLEQEQPK